MRRHLALANDSPFPFSLYEFGPLAAVAIPALIGAAGSVASSLFNKRSSDKANKANQKINDENLALTREEFDYQKQLNSALMSREDTAYQRAVSDAQAAGLSPLVVSGTGGAGSGGSVSGFSGQASTHAMNPFQMETNSLADAMRSISSAYMQERLQDKQIAADTASQASAQTHEMTKLSAQLDAQDAMLDKQLEATAQIEDKRLKEQEARRIQDKKIFNATQRNIYEAKNQEQRMAASSEARKAAAAIGVKNFEPYTDWDKYVQVLQARSAGAQSRASDSWSMTQGYDETVTNGGSSSIGADVGSKFSAGVAGTSAGTSASESGTSSSSMHSSAVQQMNHAEVEYWNKHGYPVYVGQHSHKDID